LHDAGAEARMIRTTSKMCLLTVIGLGCAASVDDGRQPEGELDGKADEGSDRGAIYAGIRDDGSSIGIPAGTDLVIWLPSNPSTGFDWRVKVADEPLGPPDSIHHESYPHAYGWGDTLLTWSTTDVAPGSTAEIFLELERYWPADVRGSYSLFVEIVERPLPEAL
jgi:predicted secreted protein